MNFRSIIVLLAVTGIASPAQAENWFTVYKYKEKTSLAVDLDRITRKGSKANFYLTERDGKKSMVFNVEVNCQNRQFRTLSLGNSPKASMSLLADPNGGWEKSPNKDKTEVINYICGKG